ncbi:tryptophan dimethylallyltransferase-domain-containing protein [Xylaria telfairii]|nr:tryptophan dimethylallyltransferase-domain-containing protein [Xylaria telfairii]
MDTTHALFKTQIIKLSTSYEKISPWQQPSSEPSHKNEDHTLWNHHVGNALGVLLSNANYSLDVQRRNLDFFKQVVAPNLGIFQAMDGNRKPLWRSFMTDDGTPLELSWDWGTNNSQPTIRYSIEPIGAQAGTPFDPRNLLAGPALQEGLNQTLPGMRLETFHYFREFFLGHTEHKIIPYHGSSVLHRCLRFLDDFFAYEKGATRCSEGVQDHSSSIFYAFDLTETGSTAKVYFFPKYRAQLSMKSNLEIIQEGIQGAPHCTPDNLHALSVFSDFSNDAASKDLEYEMLAIDLVDPLQSRFKIYFRSRETSFDSLRRIITLGGRIEGGRIQRGLRDLNCLWNAIFEVDAPPSHPLKEVNHRTAGMLYNVEFRIADRYPVAKVYLPVRHYSSSDDNVIKGLDHYFQSHQGGSYMASYRRAMDRLFGSESLRSQAGVQTYVGCTIRPDGALRIVSYFKPPLADPIPPLEECV